MRPSFGEVVPSCASVKARWSATCWLVLVASACAAPTGRDRGDRSARGSDEAPSSDAMSSTVDRDRSHVELSTAPRKPQDAQPDVRSRDECPVVHVDVNGGDGCAVTAAGAVYCWGIAALAALGRAETHDRCLIGAGDTKRDVPCSLTPVRVPGIDDAIEVSLGAASCALERDGQVRCWGSNQSHALGTEVAEQCDNPYATAPAHAASVPCSADPVLVDGLEDAVKLQAWGQTCALTGGGEVKCWGYHYPSATSVPGVTGAVSTSASCALLADGEVRCWGSAESGRLGTSQALQTCSGPYNQPCTLTAVPVELQARAREVASGWQHACAVAEDGHVHCWGHNGYGQLGIGRDSKRCASGFPCEQLPHEVPQLNEVTQLRAGIGSTCALTADGRAHCWGNLPITGLQGTTPNERVVPLPDRVVSMSAERGGMCFVLESGELYCAGLRYELDPEHGVGVLSPSWSPQRMAVCD